MKANRIGLLRSIDVMPIGANVFRQLERPLHFLPVGSALLSRSIRDRSEKVSDIVQNKGQAGMPVNRLWVVQRDHTGNTDWPAGEAETTAADRTSFRKLSAMFAMGYSR
jgi:hypothetical protein